MSKTERNSRGSITFGLVGLILGMMALTGSVGHFWLGPLETPPALEDTIADEAMKIRDKVVARLKGDATTAKVVPSRWGPDRVALAVIAGASLLAILFGVIGFVRHEPLRIVGSAAILGGSALALQYLIVAIGAIVFAIIIGAILGGLGFGG